MCFVKRSACLFFALIATGVKARTCAPAGTDLDLNARQTPPFRAGKDSAAAEGIHSGREGRPCSIQ